MKIYLSHGKGPTAAVLRQGLEAKGIQVLGDTTALVPGTDVASTVERWSREADALVFLLEPAADERDRIREEERRAAIDLSWSTPRKPLIPIVVGDAELPAFLRESQAIRIPSQAALPQSIDAIASAIESFCARPETAVAESHDQKEAEKKQRFEQIAAEANKLVPTTSDLEEQHAWLSEQIEAVTSRNPDSALLADLFIQRSDVRKGLERKRAALDDLQRAVEILDHQTGKREQRRLARTRINLAYLMLQLGDLEAARTQWDQARAGFAKVDGKGSINIAAARTVLSEFLKTTGEPLTKEILAALADDPKEAVPLMKRMFDRLVAATIGRKSTAE